MDKKTSNQIVLFILVYVVFVVCDLIIGSSVQYIEYRLYSKPAILSTLIIYFLAHKNSVNRVVFGLTILALLFSLAGDILLLFVSISPWFFISGLVMFLLAHVMYILVFRKKQKKQNRNLAFLLLTIVYAIIFFYVLFPSLDDMVIPVLLYMIVILIMSNTAYLRNGRVSPISFKFVFIGSLLFMLSDSLLAYTVFCTSIFLENVWIMSTYALAQLLILFGILKQEEGAVM